MSSKATHEYSGTVSEGDSRASLVKAECTPIYNHNDKSNINTELNNLKALNFFKKMHTEKKNSEMTLKERLNSFRLTTGYSILEISEIKNTSIDILHKSCITTKTFDNNTKIVIHGVKYDSVEKKCKEGLSHEDIKDGNIGKGFYTFGVLNIALYDSTPNEHNEQFLIFSKLSIGPSTIGKKGLTEFGEDKNGKQIMTLTDGKFAYCSRDPEQILPIIVLKLKCETIDIKDKEKVLLQVNRMIYYNTLLWNKLKNNKNVIGSLAEKFANKNIAIIQAQTEVSIAVNEEKQYKARVTTIEGQINAAIQTHTESLALLTEVQARLIEAQARVFAAKHTITYQQNNLLHVQKSANVTATKIVKAKNNLKKVQDTSIFPKIEIETELQEYISEKDKIIRKNDSVIIKIAYSNYINTVNREGIVKKIVKKNGIQVLILMNDTQIKNYVIEQNKIKIKGGFPYVKNQNESWLAVSPHFIEVISSDKNDNSGIAIVGDKRKNEDNSNGNDSNGDAYSNARPKIDNQIIVID